MPRVRARLLLAGSAVVVAIAVALMARELNQRYLVTTPPDVPRVDLRDVFFDAAPVKLLITVAWQKVPIVAARDDVRSDPWLWRNMHFEDWNLVPRGLREETLDAMLSRYRAVVTDPDVWDRMGAHEWDWIPQPIRALAYRHMAEYWSGYYQVGAAYDIPRGLMGSTLAAIVMAESWFEHRAVNTNPLGNRDLGVAQASDGARERFREMYRAGDVDVWLDDDDYFNPWAGTRFVALWMDSLLRELDGDLDAAIRAYHRGAERVRHDPEEGAEYLETVKRRRRRYIRNQDSGPAWDYLWRRDRAIKGADWPWMKGGQSHFFAILGKSVTAPLSVD